MVERKTLRGKKKRDLGKETVTGVREYVEELKVF
jgi:hypothetical protein